MTFALKDYSSFRILGTTVAESAEDVETDKAKKHSSTGEFLLSTVYLLGAAGLLVGAYFFYDNFVKKPDSY